MASFLMWTMLLVASQTMDLIDAQTTQTPQTCDSTFTPMSTFDETQYAGVWYTYREYNIFWDRLAHATCQNYTFTVETGTSKFTVIYKFKALLGVPVTTNGVLTPLATNQPAKFTLTSPDLKSVLKGSWWVMATDYINYSVVISCTDIPEFGKPVAGNIYYGILIVTRAKVPSPQTITAIQNSMQSLDLTYNLLGDEAQKGC